MPPPLIIVASARKQGNTDGLANSVFKCMENEMIHLLDFTITPYTYAATYPPNDGFMIVIEKLLQHQVIILATPVYWYSMSGLMKTFFDRFTDLVTVKKQIGRSLKGKSVFLLVSGSDIDLPEAFEAPFKLTFSYLEMEYGGCLYQPEMAAAELKKQASFIEAIKQVLYK